MKLINGDCLEVMKNIPENSIDMVLVDPPYGVTNCKWDSVIDIDRMWQLLYSITKKTTPIVIMAGQPFTSRIIMSNPVLFKYSWVWEKEQGTNFAMAKRQPMKVHEDVCVFYEKQCLYNPQGLIDCSIAKGGKNKFRSDNIYSGGGVGLTAKYVQKKKGYPRTVQKFNRETGLHPTQKPVALMEYLVKTYTNGGDTILDFTMGSGTTGVACANLGRKFIGIELDEGYFEIAKERIQAVKLGLNDIE